MSNPRLSILMHSVWTKELIQKKGKMGKIKPETKDDVSERFSWAKKEKWAKIKIQYSTIDEMFNTR